MRKSLSGRDGAGRAPEASLPRDNHRVFQFPER
jgi:hypothetical protein